jgi:hypothetical protein
MTKFAKNSAVKKTAENGNIALCHAGVKNKSKFKEGTCLKNTNTI